MSILQALFGHYRRLESESTSDLPRYGFSREKISYSIVLSVDGDVVDVVPRLDTSGKTPRPSLIPVPQPCGRTSTLSGAVTLRDDARKTVLIAYQERKKDEIMHPFLKEKTTFGLVPFVQAMLMARWLRNELDGYPPFLWR